MKIKFLIISSLIISITPLFIHASLSYADTIILKNGQRVVVDMAWEEGDYIRGSRTGGIIGFSKDSVENVIYEKDDQKGSDSFQFDMWKGGITINKAMKIAQSHDLPINKVGLISGATKFRSSVYEQLNSADKFYYKTKLLGKNAAVTLCFTPTSRLLYKIIVNLYGPGVSREGEYKDEVESMLCQKYGNPEKSSKHLLWDRCNWNVNNSYTVSMVNGMTAIDIVYSDISLEKKNTVENQIKKDKEKSEYTKKDSIKF